MSWNFGFDHRCPVINMCDADRGAIFYASAHTGIIYDVNSKSQRLLQGHCNPITCACASADRRLIATSDRGANSMLVVWDSYSTQPVKTIATPHPQGVHAMDMSPDGGYLVTLYSEPAPEGEAGEPQVLAVWDCSPAGSTDTPIFSRILTGDEDGEADELQISVRFDPSLPTQIVTNGASVVIFWSFWGGRLTWDRLSSDDYDFTQSMGKLTKSLFFPDSTKAVTATEGGTCVLWERKVSAEFDVWYAANIVQLHTGAVTDILTIGKYLVSGGADGHVRFYDYCDFKLRNIVLFEDLDAGTISSISFAVPTSPGKATSATSDTANSEVLSFPDFIVGTSLSLILACQPSMVYEPKAENKRGTNLVMGLNDDAQMEDSEASKKRGNGSVGKQGGGKEPKAEVLGAQDQAQYSPTVIQIHDALAGAITFEEIQDALAKHPDAESVVLWFSGGGRGDVSRNDLSGPAPDSGDGSHSCSGSVGIVPHEGTPQSIHPLAGEENITLQLQDIKPSHTTKGKKHVGFTTKAGPMDKFVTRHWVEERHKDELDEKDKNEMVKCASVKKGAPPPALLQRARGAFATWPPR